MHRPRPTTFIALLALFFALGGSAFALGTKVAPQGHCAQGAIRGIAEVTGQPTHGVANVPDQYTSATSYFGKRFNCGGGAIQIRRLTAGTFQIKFAGNAATSALISSMGGDAAGASITHNPDGSFGITLGTKATLEDVPFTVVLV
jgi:hypothetical protein